MADSQSHQGVGLGSSDEKGKFNLGAFFCVVFTRFRSSATLLALGVKWGVGTSVKCYWNREHG